MEDFGDPERVLGDAMRARRLAQGWSQEELARKMQAAGFNWLQSTVAKTEAAGRPVRLNEAFALAQLFDVSLDSLVQLPSNHPLLKRHQHEYGEYAGAERDLRTAREQLEYAEDVHHTRKLRFEALDGLVRAVRGGSDEVFAAAVQKLVAVFRHDGEWREILAEVDGECDLPDAEWDVIKDPHGEQFGRLIAGRVAKPDAGVLDGQRQETT